MPGGWRRTGALAIVFLAACPPRWARADDDVAVDVPVAPVPAAILRAAGEPPGIDLAAHVDINVVLPPNQWRIGGGIQNIVVAGGGRLVIDGNLTIGGEAVPDSAERVRRADEALMVRLRKAQVDRLAAAATDPRSTAPRRRALELATEVDIRRVMTDVARLRHRYADRRANLGDEVWQRFQEDVQECRRSIADPFGDDSLFAAVRANFAAAAAGP